MKGSRLAYAALGIVAIAVAIASVAWMHASWSQIVVFAIAPDVTLLAGAAPGVQRGQLSPRAVPFYNAVHRFWIPVAMMVVAGLLQQVAWFAGGLAWIAHIAVDRSLGFGLRTPEGFQRTR